MEEYKKAYEELNDNQKNAVEHIDGPVMVVAGPGTGKTQLLALRTANILQKNPTILPNNILCLTFTDSAAHNLRERLIKYIGQSAYKVGVFTFHSFGSYVMGIYPEFFYGIRQTKVADELTVHELIEKSLGILPVDSDLAKRSFEGEFYSHKMVKNFISDAKNASLSPEQMLEILNTNTKDLNELLPLFKKYWPLSLSSKNISLVYELVEELSFLKSSDLTVSAISPLKNMLILSLGLAVKESASLEGRSVTKPLTAWKERWLIKTEDGWEFKSQKQNQKLIEVNLVYKEYQNLRDKQGLVDFSDQINWTLKALSEQKDLVLNLREQFQYIMVDEFQDTNRSQLLLTRYLCGEGKDSSANILVVGDDDQAIYRFQGADIANIGEFEQMFPEYETINLDVNYRSSDPIIKSAEKINSQIEYSLKNLKSIDKTLIPNEPSNGIGTVLNEFEYDTEQNSYIAEQVKSLLKKPNHEIAILGRERAQLDDLVPYLRHLNVPIDYERRENVLEQEHITTLLNMVRLVDLLAQQKYQEANALIPQIISEPMWGIKTEDIWLIAKTAYDKKILWVDAIYKLKLPKLVKIADFFVNLSGRANSLPAEAILDKLIGSNAKPDDEEQDYTQLTSSAEPFVSPFKQFFFSEETLSTSPEKYLAFLSHLSTLRSKIRDYQSANETMKIADLIKYIDSFNRAGLRMLDKSPHNENPNAVKLMTVHSAKGLEFDTVFVVGLTQQSWTKSGGNSRFAYPLNLAEIRPSDNQEDDGLRLLFVAMTRAKQNLYLNYYRSDESSKKYQPYAPLLSLDLKPNIPKLTSAHSVVAEQYEQRWLKRHASFDNADLKSLLKDKLDSYQLSATHLNNFTDVTQGGPLYYLTQNLLNFPSSILPSSAYGSAIHALLSYVHATVISGKKIKKDELLDRLHTLIDDQTLSEDDKIIYKKQGIKVIENYILKHLSWFKPDQKTEFDFKGQGVVIEQARLKGLADVIELNKKDKTVEVFDYKTGSALSSWDQPPSAHEYNRIKAHKYRQQLLFYKLLIDGSSEYGLTGNQAVSGSLIFVEPDNYGKIRQLKLVFEDEEVARTRKLIVAVWNKIMNLDFSDTDNYPKTAEGIIMFENDLINSYD